MSARRIGVLVCDDLHEGLATAWPSYGALFEAMLGGAGVVRQWRVHAGEWPTLAEADTWVITGSRASAYDRTDWVVRLRGFVAEAHRGGRRLVGVCFGHQVVHAALGGVVAPAATGWGLGIYPVAALSPFGVWSPGDPLALLAVHQDQVLEPAPGLRTLAGGPSCPHFVTAGDNVFSVQGHPEFDREFFQALLPRVGERVGTAAVQRARESLEAPDHQAAFRQLLREFAAAERGHGHSGGAGVTSA